MTQFTVLLLCLVLMGCQKTPQSKIESRDSSQKTQEVSQMAIYGEDNRLDFFEVSSPVKKSLSKSVAAVVAEDSIQIYSNGSARILGRELRHSSLRVCESTPYSHQIKGAYGSAALIGEDLILTAGHVTDNGACPSSYFVFGFKRAAPQSDGTYVKASDVYSCKRVEFYSHTESNKDLAIIRLDRAVTNYKPLTVSFGGVQRNDDLWMAGYPSGVPLKITDGAKVLAQNRFFFRSTLDAFGGNSGSPVFNARNEVVGVLVRGEGDYETVWSPVEKRNCAIPKTFVLGEKQCEPTLFEPSKDDWGGFETVASKCYGEQVSQVKELESVLSSIR